MQRTSLRNFIFSTNMSAAVVGTQRIKLVFPFQTCLTPLHLYSRLLECEFLRVSVLNLWIKNKRRIYRPVRIENGNYKNMRYISSSEKMSIESLCPFFTHIFWVFLQLSCRDSLYILGMNALSDMYANIISIQ